MIYRVAADALVVAHGSFVLFVVLGGLLVRWRQRVIWLHLPALIWGAGIEIAGGICPLTPLENHLRTLGGEAGYRGDFVDHYLLPVLYPDALTHHLQVVFALAVLCLNAAIYAPLARRAWLARGGRRRWPPGRGQGEGI